MSALTLDPLRLSTRAAGRPNLLVAAAFLLLTLVGVWITAPAALPGLLLDGLAAAVVTVPPILGGLWLAAPFLPAGMPLCWHFLLGAGLGFGATSLLVLSLGLLAVLDRSVWIMLLGCMAVGGLVRLRMLVRRQPVCAGMPPAGPPGSTPLIRSGRPALVLKSGPKATGGGHSRWLWLLACPFAVLALSAASHAPGFLWAEEGFGYDVLEYHLQLPKEYLKAGRIGFLEHNVYANFPQNVEMYYLLAMIVHDDVYDIGTVTHLIHAMFAVLAVFAGWVACAPRAPTAGAIAGLLVATAGWPAYLCGLAYVENGMLFFGMTATAALLEGWRRTPGSGSAIATPRGSGVGRQRRWIAVAGLMAGFACGCKYTAALLITVPLVVLVFLGPVCGFRQRVFQTLLFVAACLAAWAPWLAKNWLVTGNPVFPLANSCFHAAPPGWGEYETQHWDRGHRPPSDEQSSSAKIRAVWNRILGDPYQRFGPVIWLLATAGALGYRGDPLARRFLLLLFSQLGLWMAVTHLFARFAVVLLIPLALLGGMSVTISAGRFWKLLVTVVLLGGATWNFAFARQLHKQETFGGAPASVIYNGTGPGYEYFEYVNHMLPEHAKILLVGEGRAYYFRRMVDYWTVFNRNPFFFAIQSSARPDEVVDWLCDGGYSHVFVNWAEVERLASTYGFCPPIDARELDSAIKTLSPGPLQLVHEQRHPVTGRKFVELYEVRSCADRK